MTPRSQYLIAVGDSQVAGTSTEIPYPAIVAASYYDRRLGYISLALPGNTSTQIADAYLAAQSAYRDFDALLDLGSNNANGTDQQRTIILADIARLVAAHTTGRWRLAEILPRSDRQTDVEPGRSWLEALNSTLAGLYGSKFVRRLPGLQAAAVGANDAADVAANLVPRSLLKDGVHRTQAGVRIEATIFAASIDGGW